MKDRRKMAAVLEKYNLEKGEWGAPRYLFKVFRGSPCR